MANIISRLAENISIGDSPWQFRLLTMLVIIFFFGGLALDYWASIISLPTLSGEEVDRDIDQMLVNFTKDKHESLTSSANLMYDFSKIALGALIASVAQGKSSSQKINKEIQGSNS
jgi:hypothetical protein